MTAGSDTLEKNAAAESRMVADLRIRLKHIRNDYALTRTEYEAATSRYLEVLAVVNRKNRELEALKQRLEERVCERTAMLEQSNRALRESEQRLQLVWNATSDGIWDRNLLTDEVYFSPGWEHMLGYAAGEIRAHFNAWLELVHPDDRDAMLTAMQAHLTGNSAAYGAEIRMRNQAGHWQWIMSRGKVITFSDAGRPLRMVGTHIDITARRRAEEQMTQAAKMIALGTLVAGVAHEINNPNNFIMLGAPILRKYFDGITELLDAEAGRGHDLLIAKVPYRQVRDDLPRLLDGIMEGARRIRNIVRDLHDFARPDTADLDQAVDLNKVIGAVVNLMQGALRKATASFKVVYAVNLPAVSGNAHKLEQAFVNLLRNACESLPDTSRAITLRTGHHPAQSAVWVRLVDEGAGIPADIRPFIFDPFFTTKRETGGTGLGLTTAGRIFELHGAEMKIDSRPGRGTAITVLFPANET